MVCADYAYFSDEGRPNVTFIVVYIRPFSCDFSAVIDSKGPSAFVVTLLAEWIQQCGLVNFFTDQTARLH